MARLLVLLFIFISCEEKELQEIREQKLNSVSETSNPPGNSSQNIQCNAFSILKLECTDQKINSISANLNRVCNSSGTSLTDTACKVEECRSGFNKQNNECVPMLCTPNLVSNVNCKNEISNSKTAIKQITCNESGTGISASVCQLGQCEDSHYKSGNSCIPKVCVANQNTQEICTGSIANAKLAVKNQFCGFDNQVSLGACLLKTCNNGYQNVGNACVPMICSPAQPPVNFLCKDQIPNSAIAYITRTCNQYGSGEIDSLCTLNSCNPGFFKVGNSCVVEGTGGGSGGGGEDTYSFTGVTDLPAPSQTKMTCKDWLAENGIGSVRPDQVRSIRKNRSTLTEEGPRIARCAYIIKLTQNGNQNSFCQSMGWDISSFQGTYDTYDEIIPTASCNEDNGSLHAIETNVYRLASTVGPARVASSNLESIPPISRSPSGVETYIYTNVSDLKLPSKNKMTCEDWLIENGVNPSIQEDVRSVVYNLTSGNADLPKQRSCAYLVTHTQNGEVKTRCESLGIDFMSFQGSFSLYDKIQPVPSCQHSNDKNKLIETNILRDSSKIGTVKLLINLSKH